MRRKIKLMKWAILLFWIILCFAVAGMGGQWTAQEIPNWYRSLVRPGIAPPNWVFGPVWTLLYLMMAIAAWRVTISERSTRRKIAIVLFLVQLGLNLLWTWVFFSQHMIGWAVIEIACLWVAIAACICVFRKISRSATWMMVPYLAWVSFAGVLNFEFWRLNSV